MHFLKRSSSALIFIIAVWVLQSPAFACAIEGCGISTPEDSSLRVASDLDGDWKTDSASAHFSGTGYSIEVSLTTERPRVRLNVPVWNEVGLELVAYDVDHDRRDDLILVSASSLEPIAVWLNRGDGSFERSTRSFAPLFGAPGSPRFRRASARNDIQAAISTDDSPDAFEFVEDLVFRLESQLIGRQTYESSLTTPERGSASPRGPPSSPA